MMIMELQQDNNNNNQLLLGSKDISQIIKGKRKKRQRPLSPLALTMSASANLVSTSSTEYQGIVSNSSPTTSTNCGFPEISCTAEEEEDMANCLILLAQGHSKIRKNPITQKVVFQSEKVPHEISVIGNHNKSGGTSSGCGLFVYQCKTCDRCFASFQALGGHRASHKKPKFNSEGNNKKALLSFKEQENNIIGHHNQDHQFDQNSTSTDLSLLISNRVGLNSTNKNKPKVHECSICRAEFTSGQALGGHMRRHRSFTNTQTSAVTATATTTSLSLASRSPESDELKKSRNMLQLDLNLPAPEDDCRESKFPFTGKEQVMVFSHASPLVDCHY